MTQEQAEKHVEILAAKAAAAEDPTDALKFSQAATNVANALCGLVGAKK